MTGRTAAGSGLYGLAAALLLFADTASGQAGSARESHGALNAAPAESLTLFPSSIELRTGPLEIDAGLLELFRPQQRVRASDGVEIRLGDRTLLAQEATVDLAANRLILEGPFRLLSPQGVITGERAELELDPLAGILYRGTLITSGGGLRLTAARIRRDPDGSYAFTESELTACDCAPNVAGLEDSSFKRFMARPSWSVKARRLRLTWDVSAAAPAPTPGMARDITMPSPAAVPAAVPAPTPGMAQDVTMPSPAAVPAAVPAPTPGIPQDITMPAPAAVPAAAPAPTPGMAQDNPAGRGRVVLEGATFRLKGLPVFYLPRGAFPVGHERVSGLLAPGLTQNQDGLIFRVPYYLVTGPSSDLTMGLTANQSRGLGLDLEHRYLFGPEAGGQINVAWLYDLKRAEAGQEASRWALRWKHQSAPGSKLRLVADLNEVSDPDYVRDFGGALETRSGESLATRARVEVQGERGGVSLGLEHFTELQSGQGSSTLARAPELRLNGRGPGWSGGWGALQVYGAGEAFYQAAVPGWGGTEPSTVTLPPGRLYARARPSLSWGRPLGRWGALKGELEYEGTVEATPEWAGDGASKWAGEGESVWAGAGTSAWAAGGTSAWAGEGTSAWAGEGTSQGAAEGTSQGAAEGTSAWAGEGTSRGAAEASVKSTAEEAGGRPAGTGGAWRNAAKQGGALQTFAAGSTVTARQVVTGKLELSTALVRTFLRPGRFLVKLQHRIEPSIGVWEDLLYWQGPGFEAPVGEASGRVERVTAGLTQRLWGRQAKGSGGRLIELATFRLALGRDLGAGGRLTDLGAWLELRGPVTMRFSGLIDPYSGRASWLQGRARYAAGPAWLEVAYGRLEGTQPARPPDGPALALAEASELTVGAGVRPGELLEHLGAGQWWLRGWRIEALTRLGLDSGVTPYTRRLALRYDSPCRCFSAQLFVALDRDRSFPDLRARVLPGPLGSESGGGEWP